MKPLSRKHKALINTYLDITNKNTFLNKMASYNYIYKGNGKHNATRVFNRPEVKKEIDVRIKAMVNLTKEDYLIKLEKELENCKQAGARVRLLELIGKSLNFLKDNEIQNNTNVINIKDLSEKLSKRMCDI